MGDGLPPVPAKLAKKIQGGEFVDMHELLPELWSSVRDEGGAPRTSRVRERSESRISMCGCSAMRCM